MKRERGRERGRGTEPTTSFFYSNIVKFKFHNIFSSLTFDENTILTVDDLQTYNVVKRMFFWDWGLYNIRRSGIEKWGIRGGGGGM